MRKTPLIRIALGRRSLRFRRGISRRSMCGHHVLHNFSTQGILSQAFTDPNFRGEGIAKATVREAINAFQGYVARAVYLASAKEWVREMYRKVGFEFVEAMAQRHAFKLTLEPSGEDRVLFRSGQQTRIWPMQADDQADLSALFNSHNPCGVKHYGLGVPF